jgi:ribosomal protein S18
MKRELKLSGPKVARQHNIVDMGLGFSGMMRLFRKGSKEELRKKIVDEDWVRKVSQAKSKEDFNNIHSDFCNWGINNVYLAKKKTAKASYGQIAKTFDVVLLVAVYYCRLPSRRKSREISGWLNSAVDNKMMDMLRECYPEAFKSWPRTIAQVVKRTDYKKIQEIVRKFISEKHKGKISPVQFDDIYWKALNR